MKVVVQCKFCARQIQIELPPLPPTPVQHPVQAVVLQWSDNAHTDERPMIASIGEDGGLTLGLTSQDGRKVFLGVPLGKEVPRQQGAPQAFELQEIHPGVLKLNMSVLDPMVHAFVTIVGAPEDWRST